MSKNDAKIKRFVFAKEQTVMSKLLEKGIDVNVRYRDKEKDKYTNKITALMYQCFMCNCELVNFLLTQENINLNLQNEYGFTALHYAAMNNCSIILLTLLALGADYTIADNSGKLPKQYLDISTKNGKLCVEYIEKFERERTGGVEEMKEEAPALSLSDVIINSPANVSNNPRNSPALMPANVSSVIRNSPTLMPASVSINSPALMPANVSSVSNVPSASTILQPSSVSSVSINSPAVMPSNVPMLPPVDVLSPSSLPPPAFSNAIERVSEDNEIWRKIYNKSDSPQTLYDYLKNNINVYLNIKNPAGKTPLIKLVKDENIDKVKILLGSTHPIDLNATDDDGNTALYYACQIQDDEFDVDDLDEHSFFAETGKRPDQIIDISKDKQISHNMIKLLLDFGAEGNRNYLYSECVTDSCRKLMTEHHPENGNRFNVFGYSFGGNQLARRKEKLVKELKNKYESTGWRKTIKNWFKRGGKNMRHTKKGKKQYTKKGGKKGGKKRLNKTRNI